MTPRVLFIGFEDCEYCQKANDFLEVCGYDVDWLKSSKKRKDKLPEEYTNWQGEYIFHMKSCLVVLLLSHNKDNNQKYLQEPLV